MNTIFFTQSGSLDAFFQLMQAVGRLMPLKNKGI